MIPLLSLQQLYSKSTYYPKLTDQTYVVQLNIAIITFPWVAHSLISPFEPPCEAFIYKEAFILHTSVLLRGDEACTYPETLQKYVFDLPTTGEQLRDNGEMTSPTPSHPLPLEYHSGSSQ